MILRAILLCCSVQIVLGRNTPKEFLEQGSAQCSNFDEAIKYPRARRDDSVVDDYHGTKVADPYRWLEDPDSNETKRFVDAQNQISDSMLTNCKEWQKINKKLTNVWNYPKFSIPSRHGKYYFFSMNSGLQNQNVIYKQKSLEDDEPAVLLDPNELSADGTVSINTMAFSEDGSSLAYSVSESGSDWTKIKIRDVESGKDFPDLLQRVKFSGITWTHDNKGFFYARYLQNGSCDGSENDKNENQKLYYHRIGDPQDKDVLVVEFLDYPRWLISTEITEDGQYLIVSTSIGNDNQLFYADLTIIGEITKRIPLTHIVTQFDGSYSYVANMGSRVVFRTNKNAPNYRLIVIDLENPDEKNWKTLIEESKNDVLDAAICVNQDKVLTVYIQDVKSVLKMHSLETGKLIRNFPLEIGNIVAINGGKNKSEFFLQMTSFLTPGIIYRFDFEKPEAGLTVYREVKLNLEGFDRNNFKVEQVFYPSRDGTKIPMYIIQKKTSNKSKPCLLYGYGGFAISTMPSFTATRLFFIDSFDGILAIANIRGGGEYGEKWHDAGRLLNKQNVFDDFQTAAEYLVKNEYTQREKIAIQGRSNGGLLVGACLTQRPDLFGAAVAQVGVMDMLRYYKFTIGAAWIPDYGDPQEKIHFENIFKYSPLHNVHAPNSTMNQYPPILITTADHDDRVSPLHSLKFAATLQHAVEGNKFQENPIILRVYSDAGHGGGVPTAKAIEGDTDMLTFLYRALHIDIGI